MPSNPRKTFKTRIHRRVAAVTLATFALLLGVVTFAGAPLPQSTTAATGTTTTSSAQTVSSSASGQTSSATLTTSTS